MWEEMAKIRKKYLVAFTKVDSAHLAEPALRRRVYILLVRRPFSTDMVVSSNGNTQKWMVYNNKGNPTRIDDWGYPYFRKPPYVFRFQRTLLNINLLCQGRCLAEASEP